jgi:hypothetical protein
MTTDSLPITVLVPENIGAPVEIYDQHAALKLAVVERDGVGALGEEWDDPGVYVLIDRHGPDGTWGAYAGKAPAGIRARLGAHLRNKDHWYRAVLVRRDTTFGFNSAQVGFLEGRLYDLLQAAEDARLHNANRPSDETLPPYDRQMLELVVLPVARVMRLLGHDPATADDSPAPAGRARRTSRFFGITLAELVEAGLLEEGSALVSANGAWPASATVVAGGSIEMDGTVYPTPSAAAAAVKDGPANGWAFWAVETAGGRTTLATLRAKLLEYRAEAPS